MQFRRRGVSTVMAALAVVVVAIIVGAGVYFVASGSSGKTVTQTSTVTTGGGSTVVGSTTTTSATTGTSAAASVVPADLVAACAAEGNAVTLYDSFTTTANAVVTKDWSLAFPSITLTATPGLTAAQVTSDSLTQYQAGHVMADAISNNFASLMQLNSSGVLQSFDNYAEQLEGYPAGYTIAPGIIHPSTEDVDLLVYNTKLVTDTSTLPKNWTDLENPIWKGKIAIDNPTLVTVAGEMLAAQEPAMGNASWTQMLKGIDANNPTLTTSASAALSDLTSGQASLAIVLLSSYNTAVQAGNPVAVVPGFAGQAHETGISLATDAPHPACGELLIQWWASFAGQEMIIQSGRGPALPSAREINATAVLGSLPANTTINAPSSVPVTYYTNSTEWADYYNTIFGGLG
jgi:iron(III) transport system substrate-binding protein